ncbi:type IV pilus modification protein PilV [Pseudomonas sp. 5P_3.1_Bac2]|uniref:type IV pilus modification protein PilV n=1 Tax=Pseudomonas sp. 5P_3.1_Bac2 TaxID=2971617 RepID=UPI0021C83B3F|nr:type IV pilus modification protein PilV [Pseudomonas sp. 5P_3.1_Bac2]MCU1718153.1 type IV pilus modification protein PilV [Pseudomonas sp. 5P_3.1_Bac2]
MLSRTSRSNRGFSLIEVLIALFVLAIGLLGMATLMMASLQSSQGAALRSAATVAAYDLAERMRLNRTQLSAYAGNPATATDPGCADNSAGCNAADTARLDLFRWSGNLQANLPGATAVIQQVTASNYCLAIFWQEPGLALTASENTSVCGVARDGRAFYSQRINP